MKSSPHRLGKYELRERLGSGGMAEVWKALDTQLQRYVAIKLLHTDLQNDPTFITRFLREARMMAALRHPNIVQLHDFQVVESPEAENPIAYMVMDYIEGPTLANYIHTTSGAKHFPTPGEVVNLFASICSAVEYAHRRGMIHRDLKPANILLDEHYTAQNPMGEPMLTDFGIARLLGPSTGAMSGSWLGTFSYTAPEQVQGHPGTERSDIYSLGVILYELCTGVLPFQDGNPTKLVSQQLTELPTPPALINPHIPPALSQVILRCLAKNAQDRFASAEALAVALAETIPESLKAADRPVEVDMRPTSINPPTPSVGLPRPVSSSSPSLSADGSALPSPVAHLPNGATPLPPAQNVSGGSPLTPPVGVTPSAAAPISGYGIQNVAIPASPSLPLQRPVAPPPPKRRRRPLFIALIAILIVVLLGAGLGGFFVFLRTGAGTEPDLGVAFFVSSGQIREGDIQGVEDQFQITLHHIPQPASGKSYYAWLLKDKLDTTQTCKPRPLALQALPLGRLPINASGDVSLLYPGNSQHTNLIASYSRFLVTEQNMQAAPVPPTAKDTSTWRYYAELPQQPSKVTPCLRTVDYMRRFLADGAQMLRMGIRGGINLRIFKNTQKIVEWTGSARDAWGKDSALIKRQVVRILLLLDSKIYARNDLPADIPLQINEDVQIPMIQVVQYQTGDNTSYIRRIRDQLNQLLLTPGITPEIRQIATQNLQAVPGLQARFAQVRTDAKALLAMNETELGQPAALQLLNDMQMQASSAFTGEVDASTGNVQLGVMQVYYSLQQLATLHVQKYKPAG